MNGLPDLFRRLQQDQDYFLGTKKGSEFEDRIMVALNNLAYTRILKEDIAPPQWSDIKRKQEDKWSETRLPNQTSRKQHFVYQPYGSQDYPDFLVFDGDQIYFLETKFSANKRTIPIWNSGLPRPTGIYIFASYGLKDITFFMGHSVVTAGEAKQFHNFFEKLKESEKEFNEELMGRQQYGFSAYIRKAFNQGHQYNDSAIVGYFSNPFRDDNEKAVIEYVSREDHELRQATAPH